MDRYRFVDYLGFRSLLREEELLVADSVRQWVEDRVVPIIGDYFDRHECPRHLFREMGELGLFGMTLPPEYGSAGSSYVQYGLAMLELERGDSAIRSTASVQGSLVMYPIHAFGSEAQRTRWLPLLATGERIGCFGLTEPDFGSNPGGMRTKATKDGDEWVIDGTKMWITNGTIADVAVVWAKTDEGIRGFLVEAGTPGFTAPEIQHKMSLRASVTSELVFDGCRVPAANLLPGSTIGLKAPLMCLDQARYGIAWGAIGAAMASYHAALEYAKERVQFGGKPIAGHQLVQDKLVTMVSEITRALFTTLQVGRLRDEGKGRHTHVSLVKRSNVRGARDVALMARDIHGANGITTEYPPIRHLLNMESVITYEGTHDIHTLIVGKDITGIDAFGG